MGHAHCECHAIRGTHGILSAFAVTILVTLGVFDEGVYTENQ